MLPPLCVLFACEPGVELCWIMSRDVGTRSRAPPGPPGPFSEVISSDDGGPDGRCEPRFGSRHALGGGGATSAIPRGNPSSKAEISDPWPRGLKNPVAVDGEGHRTPPPYTLSELCVIILLALAPLGGGPDYVWKKFKSRKV